MNKLLFILVAAMIKCCSKIRNRYYQFYNIQYLRWKGAKVGCNCMMNNKTILSLNPGGTLEIGDNFICRSGFRSHILGDELSSFHISGG